MDYEKKYKVTLERAREALNDGTISSNTIAYLQNIFPELKESKDEKIRKALIRFHKSTIDIDGIKGDDILTWLEKQGEQKSATIDIDKMVDNYANNKERGNEEFGKPVPCMIRAYRQGLNDAIGKVVLKPAWSEEDEKMLRTIISDGIRGAEFDMLQIGWLKSLKERYTWKPSDEQIHAFEQVYDWYNDNFAPSETLTSLYEQLKKLKEE